MPEIYRDVRGIAIVVNELLAEFFDLPAFVAAFGEEGSGVFAGVDKWGIDLVKGEGLVPAAILVELPAE